MVVWLWLDDNSDEGLHLQQLQLVAQEVSRNPRAGILEELELLCPHSG